MSGSAKLPQKTENLIEIWYLESLGGPADATAAADAADTALTLGTGSQTWYK